MGLRFWIMSLLGVGLAFGQCETPQQILTQPIQKDLFRIFERFEEQLSTLASFQNHENLIVPDERVGSYHLFSTKTEIESTTPLQSDGVRTDAEYEKVLPIGYIPERLFAWSAGKKLRFAFSSTDLALREIFVRGREFKTASGVGVGSTLEGVKKAFPNGTQGNEKNKTYWVSEGITFIAEKGSVVEVVVFGNKKTGP